MGNRNGRLRLAAVGKVLLLVFVFQFLFLNTACFAEDISSNWFYGQAHEQSLTASEDANGPASGFRHGHGKSGDDCGCICHLNVLVPTSFTSSLPAHSSAVSADSPLYDYLSADNIYHPPSYSI